MDESKALKRLMRKLTVETLWIYVVRVLMDFGPMRAYDIRKKLVAVLELKIPAITVYSVIYKLRGEGIIEQVKVGDEMLYRVTSRGIEEFKRALRFLENVISKLRFEEAKP
ncbi:MAG: PadR family transcriptional regulator [Ignisphaera sp.]|uniref:PadR family transcriptional regulator n=1 Tax=Ignisphaera aggregans TaxID=334771 RepID=A0A7C4JK46_9CREN